MSSRHSALVTVFIGEGLGVEAKTESATSGSANKTPKRAEFLGIDPLDTEPKRWFSGGYRIVRLV